MANKQCCYYCAEYGRCNGKCRCHQEYCSIHPSEPLTDSHPPDVENGPSPTDVFNELFCMECTYDLDYAYMESLCLAHRRQIGGCWECYKADIQADREAEQAEQEAEALLTLQELARTQTLWLTEEIARIQAGRREN